MKNCRSVRGLGLCVLLALFGSGSVACGGTVTNNVIGVQFGEVLSHKVKFVHMGPVIGHWAELTDKGGYALKAQLTLDGVDVTKFTSDTLFGALIRVKDPTLPDPSAFVSFFLRDDPKYVDGATKAKIEMRDTLPDALGGKSIVTAKIKLKFNLAALTLDVSIKGAYSGFQRTDEPADDPVGKSWIAMEVLEVLGGATQEFDEELEIFLTLIDSTTDTTVYGTASLPIVGAIKSKEMTDPEIGTFSSSKIKLVGVSD